MADSLSPECTPLKSKYDTCFNAWFEGYLEPAVAVSSSERSAYSKQKADEFEAKCGMVWGQYRACVQVRVPSLSPHVRGDDEEVESCDGEGVGGSLATSTRGKPSEGALSSSPLVVISYSSEMGTWISFRRLGASGPNVYVVLGVPLWCWIVVKRNH
jgi:hypothetical protein